MVRKHCPNRDSISQARFGANAQALKPTASGLPAVFFRNRSGVGKRFVPVTEALRKLRGKLARDPFQQVLSVHQLQRLPVNEAFRGLRGLHIGRRQPRSWILLPKSGSG